jgi:hypothetical protein
VKPRAPRRRAPAKQAVTGPEPVAEAAAAVDEAPAKSEKAAARRATAKKKPAAATAKAPAEPKAARRASERRAPAKKRSAAVTDGDAPQQDAVDDGVESAA